MAINLNGTGSITGLSSISSPTISGGSFPAGTAAAPGITLSGDSDTGLYSPGANQIAITTSGTAAVTVDASQRVGVGTTTVPSLLTIQQGSDDSYLRFRQSSEFDAGSVGHAIDSRNTAGNTTTQLTFRGNPLTFWNNGEAARIDSSGRLLVGTSSASSSATLQLQGNSSSSTSQPSIFLRRGSSPGSSDALGYLIFGDNSENQGAYIGVNRDGGTWTSGSSHPSRLVFSTTANGASSPTERMRIGGDGLSTFFGQTGVVYAKSATAAGTSERLFIGYHSATNISTGGTISFNVFTNGNVQNTNNSYTGISDIKLKENIVDAGSQWDDIKALRPVNYSFKAETGAETYKQLGLIAQEVELVSPGLVTESPDRDAEGNDLGTVTKSVNYSVLYMKAVKALQEAMERIETLEAKVAALESA